MTTEDLVTSAHRAFGAGNMEALSYFITPIAPKTSMSNMLYLEPTMALLPFLRAL